MPQMLFWTLTIGCAYRDNGLVFYISSMDRFAISGSIDYTSYTSHPVSWGDSYENFRDFFYG